MNASYAYLLWFVSAFCSMDDFQQFEQDFYQTGYYIDDQGRAVTYYDTE